MGTFSEKQDISIVKHGGIFCKVPTFMRIHAHEREHRRPRTWVFLTGNSGYKCPKSWAKEGNALGQVAHCLGVTFPDFSSNFFGLYTGKVDTIHYYNTEIVDRLHDACMFVCLHANMHSFIHGACAFTLRFPNFWGIIPHLFPNFHTPI